MHQVLLDPDQQFLVMPDLGGDMVRIFSWDLENLAPLTEEEPLRTDPGAGPRHGVFWKSPSGYLYYFFVGELSQFVYSYKIKYTSSGLAWTKISQIPALGPDNEKPATTAPASEIALSVSNISFLKYYLMLTIVLTI
jgi:6-phosphogluconolactonase (cycloisomerase 2 family)